MEGETERKDWDAVAQSQHRPQATVLVGGLARRELVQRGAHHRGRQDAGSESQPPDDGRRAKLSLADLAQEDRDERPRQHGGEGRDWSQRREPHQKAGQNHPNPEESRSVKCEGRKPEGRADASRPRLKRHDSQAPGMEMVFPCPTHSRRGAILPHDLRQARPRSGWPAPVVVALMTREKLGPQ